MLDRIINKLRREGIVGLFIGIYRQIAPSSYKSFQLCKDLIKGKIGIEIGGPSTVFSRKGFFPIYPIVSQLDNCNFSQSTTWEGEIAEGNTFKFDPGKATGHQYVAEAWNLAEIMTGTYDFLLSSHMIEHTANPIGAISEWVRVLNDTGTLVIIFPHKDGAFDHRRPTTTLAHLIQDFSNGMGEDDLTHLPEILELHDLDRDPGAGSYENFIIRSRKNFENRCLHHHVFDIQLAVELMNHMGLQICSAEAIRSYHIVIVARKVPPQTKF